MADIFISYSSHDREKALSLADDLRSRGSSVWVDQGGIGGAMNWSSEIVSAINDCNTLLFLISKNSASSHNCAKEIQLASEKQKNILPVILEDIQLPVIFEYPLAGLQRLQANDLEAIAKAITNLRDGKNALDAMMTMSPKLQAGRIGVAILPFDDLSPAHDNDWFADGMMDELINTLGSLEKLKVPSRTYVIYYKTNRPKAKEIASDLGVRYLVGGSVRKAGEKIRINASLTDTEENRQLWANNYDGTFDDIFDFQESVAKRIAEALQLKLTPEEIKEVEKNLTENTEAYEHYLKGDLYFHRHTRTDYDRALALFEEAIRLDPAFSAAYAMIANTSQAYYHHYSHIPEMLDRAEHAAMKVRELEGETSQSFWILSRIALRRYDTNKAVAYAKRSVEIDPHFAFGYNALGFAYQESGKIQEAASAWEEQVRLRENDVNAHFMLILSLNELGTSQRLRQAALRAIPIYERYLLFNPDDLNAKVYFASILDHASHKEKAMNLANELANESSLDGLALYNLGGLFARCNESEKAMEILKRSVQKGFQAITIFQRDPDLKTLHERKDFQTLIEDLARA